MKKKLLLIFFIVILLSTSVFASHRDEEESECGLTNIGQCIINAIIGAITGILNLILYPFVETTLSFLRTQPNVDAFYYLWRTIVSIISVLYVLIIGFSGLYLILKSDSVEGRIKAKSYLKNAIILIILIPSSFYLYDLLLKFTSGLSNIALSHVNESFFYIDYDSIGGAIEETIMYLIYLIAIIITLILLAIRYFFASIAIIFFPISILLYFFPFTQQYGKFMLNLILINLFIPFFASITLAGFSQLAHTGIFQNLQTLLATITFITIDLMLIFLALFSVFTGINQTISFAKGGYEWVTTFPKR